MSTQNRAVEVLANSLALKIIFFKAKKKKKKIQKQSRSHYELELNVLSTT